MTSRSARQPPCFVIRIPSTPRGRTNTSLLAQLSRLLPPFRFLPSSYPHTHYATSLLGTASSAPFLLQEVGTSDGRKILSDLLSNESRCNGPRGGPKIMRYSRVVTASDVTMHLQNGCAREVSARALDVNSLLAAWVWQALHPWHGEGPSWNGSVHESPWPCSGSRCHTVRFCTGPPFAATVCESGPAPATAASAATEARNRRRPSACCVHELTGETSAESAGIVRHPRKLSRLRSVNPAALPVAPSSPPRGRACPRGSRDHRRGGHRARCSAPGIESPPGPAGHLTGSA